MTESGETREIALRGRQKLGQFREWLTSRRTYGTFLRAISPNILQSRSTSLSLTAMWNVRISVDVFAYLPDDPLRLYQLEQWLPVLRVLNQTQRVHVLTRNLATMRILQETTDLGVIYARRVRDVNHVLQQTDPKVILYVNNSGQNFQVLSWPRTLHVHLNHGESDKISMASNQAKAYDRVFVAGEAAVDRYLANLIDFDGSSLVTVGRPQLDHTNPRRLPTTQRRTAMYAPTWEGETEAMNYTSMTAMGAQLVNRLVDSGRFRVVYKPHPRIVDGSPPVRSAHQRIVRAINAANENLPRGDRHVVSVDGSILDLMASCEVLISDVSSVALDWLYLHTDRPLWMTNPRRDLDRLLHASPVTAGSHVLETDDLATIAARLEESLTEDKYGDQRQQLRRYYFGDMAPGQSTKRFVEEIESLIRLRDQLVDTHDTTPHRIELEPGTS